MKKKASKLAKKEKEKEKGTYVPVPFLESQQLRESMDRHFHWGNEIKSAHAIFRESEDQKVQQQEVITAASQLLNLNSHDSSAPPKQSEDVGSIHIIPCHLPFNLIDDEFHLFQDPTEWMYLPNSVLSDSLNINTDTSSSTCTAEHRPIVVYPKQPKALQRPVYVKLLEQFQAFYNAQDSTRLARLFQADQCVEEVTRTVKYLIKPQALLTQQGYQQSSVIQDTPFVMSGAKNIVAAFDFIFNKLPDCMIFYDSVAINPSKNRKMILLTASYDYFFKMRVPAVVQELSSSTPAWKWIDVQMRGNIEIYFCNESSRVLRIQDFITSCQVSDSFVTQQQVLQYMGY
jgi:hypothetical protein